jgi:hypothetical protein
MANIPVEGTWAGDILAIMTVIAPVSSLIVAAVIPSKLGAFFSALAVSGLIIFLCVWSSNNGQSNPNQLGPAIFAGWAGLISVFVAGVVTVGRGLISWPDVSKKANSDAADVCENNIEQQA